ncbi:MAG: hypothetical protein IT462_14020 [Planctomycetes bacterium]|nr:hypothetical protein [Planctomycetota bacterium]
MMPALRRSLRVAIWSILPLLLAACAQAEASSAPAAVIGGPGNADGRFVTPRGLSYSSGLLWVVDRSGRLQCLDAAGKHRRTLTIEEVGDRGFPVGVLAVDDGCVLLDTHRHQVRVIAADGVEKSRFGRQGAAGGEFAYPQRAASDADGNLYITEYGEGDSNRVQVFSRDGRWLRAFGGGFGEGQGQFARCIGIAVAGNEVFVADVSHRIQVFDLQGRFLRQFGAYGDGPGQFRYPYGICHFDGDLFVAEYGGHRVQRLSLQGESRGWFGRSGAGAGEFNGPWDVCCDGQGNLFVADTGNHRVVKFAANAVNWRKDRE